MSLPAFTDFDLSWFLLPGSFVRSVVGFIKSMFIYSSNPGTITTDMHRRWLQAPGSDLKDTPPFCPAVSDIQRSVSWCESLGGSTPLTGRTSKPPEETFRLSWGPLFSCLRDRHVTPIFTLCQFGKKKKNRQTQRKVYIAFFSPDLLNTFWLIYLNKSLL